MPALGDPPDGAYVMTVTGAVPPSRLGFTLPHEHLYIQLWSQPDRWDYARQLEDDDLLADEIGRFQAQGGSCLVELTLPGVGRRPARIRAMSERTGLLMVMGSGWYRQPYYRPEEGIDHRPTRHLAAQLVREIEEGEPESGIRPGVIGEIGVHRDWLTPAEERVHRAVARAQRATGLAIITHSTTSEIGLEQLTIFEEEGVDPARVAIGHADSHPVLSYHLALIDRGASLIFDGLVGRPFHSPGWEDRVFETALALIEGGHADRLMLSHDLSRYEQLTAFGGTGLSNVGGVFLPRLRAAGVPESTIQQITVDNPRRLLTIAPRAAVAPRAIA